MHTPGIFERQRSSRLQKIDERMAKLRALKAAAENKDKAKERRLETKRKVLLGALLLQWMRSDDGLRVRVFDALDGFLVRPADRRLFGLTVDGEMTEASASGGGVSEESAFTASA